MEPLSKGQYIIYRKPQSGAAGSWSACYRNPDTKKQTRTHIGSADDYMEPDGTTILSYAQAQEIAAQWFKTKIRQAIIEADGDIVPHGPFTVGDAIEAFIDDAKRVGKNHIQPRIIADTWILPFFGSLPVVKLTRIKIEKWLDEIVSTPKCSRTRKGLRENFVPKPMDEDAIRARKTSTNRTLAVLKAALTQAVTKRLVDSPDRPWQLVRRYTGVERARTRFLTADEQVRLVQACPPDFAALVQGALVTGCRYMELARMKAKDFDPNNGTAFVEKSKTGKPRHIYLAGEGIAIFSKLTKGLSQDSLIFTNSKKRLTRTGSTEGEWMQSDPTFLMNQACKQSGIEPLTFHELRHTYASTLMNKGVPLVYVAAQLGHSNTLMVEKHYGHIAPSALAESIRSTVPAMGFPLASKNEAASKPKEKPKKTQRGT
jgi:integrase